MRIKGWRSVFGFTFIQYVKTKGFIAGTIIVCVIVMLLVTGCNLLPKLLGDEDVDANASADLAELHALYIDDSAGILTDEDIGGMSGIGNVKAVDDSEFDGLIESLSGSDKNEALIKIAADEYEGTVAGYRVKTYYAPEMPSELVDMVTSIISNCVANRNLMNAGVSAGNIADAQRYVSTSKITAGNDEWNMIESVLNYFVPLAVSLILFLLIFAYGQMVAQSIATEKTSKVMELLLTSVRPLAVVIGKVLAMGLVSVMQFILIGTVGGITFAVTAPFGIGGDIIEMLNNPALQIGENLEIVEALKGILEYFNVFTVIAILIIFILGFIFFALIAALVGASVSRMEDLAQAMQPYSLIGVLGFYLAYFPVMFNMDSMETGAATTNPLQIFSYYFPVSSPFALPSALLLGTLSPVQVCIAVLILAVFTLLTALLVARVYEFIIMHNGSRLKFGDILKLAGRRQ